MPKSFTYLLTYWTLFISILAKEIFDISTGCW